MAKLDNQQIKEIIASHPIFSRLTKEEINAIANLVVERSAPLGTIIVKEEDLVDSFYFIVSGTAEVRNEKGPIAILSNKETIGLSDTSFYSTSGKRTATVVAATDMVLLKLSLAAFNNFAKETPEVNEKMRESAELLARMNLIKKAAPFSKLSIDELNSIVRQVQKVSYKTGDIIFNKGDPGDNCYLIQSGKVEIFNPEEENQQSRPTLKPPMVFGETALLMDIPRSASARCVKDCELLALNRDLFLHIVKTGADVQNSLIKLLKSRNKPIKFPYIEAVIQEGDDGEKIITLKNPKEGKYYQLAEEGWFIWQLLDGQHSLRDITLKFNQQFEIFDPSMISEFIVELEDEGFLAKSISALKRDEKPMPYWLKGVMRIRQVMEASINFGNVDSWLSSSYNKVFFIFYTLPFKILFALIAVTGLYFFIAEFNKHLELFRATPHSSWLMIIAITVYMSTTVLHELSHAYTTKYYGKAISHFGLSWFWIGPTAFCDTSDMWLAKRKQRIMVDVAGFYLDLILSGLASILALFITDPLIVLFLWIFAIYNYLSIFTNLSPIIELDGYYTLMDLLGKENLKESAVTWITTNFRKTFTSADLIKKYKAEIIYWIACFIYLILAIVVPYFVLNKLLYGLFGVQNPYYSLILPLVILVFSTLSMWGEIRNKINN